MCHSGLAHENLSVIFQDLFYLLAGSEGSEAPGSDHNIERAWVPGTLCGKLLVKD